MSILVAVTDHAAERFRQRIGSRRGELDVKPEVVTRVVAAWDAGLVLDGPPAGASGARGTIYLRDRRERSVVYVCRPDGAQIVVVTLWEDEEAAGGARVPRRFTDALKETDHALTDWAARDRARDGDA